MQTIALCDMLLLRPNRTGEMTCSCDDPTVASEDNLALRAARLAASVGCGGPLGVAIELHKAVPTQAGLGGGSGDAAAVLASLNRVWALGLTLERLEELGAQLGSDVPF